MTPESQWSNHRWWIRIGYGYEAFIVFKNKFLLQQHLSSMGECEMMWSLFSFYSYLYGTLYKRALQHIFSGFFLSLLHLFVRNSRRRRRSRYTRRSRHRALRFLFRIFRFRIFLLRISIAIWILSAEIRCWNRRLRRVDGRKRKFPVVKVIEVFIFAFFIGNRREHLLNLRRRERKKKKKD